MEDVVRVDGVLGETEGVGAGGMIYTGKQAEKKGAVAKPGEHISSRSPRTQSLT